MSGSLALPLHLRTATALDTAGGLALTGRLERARVTVGTRAGTGILQNPVPRGQTLQRKYSIHMVFLPFRP